MAVGGARGAAGHPDRGPLAAQPMCRGPRAVPALGHGVFPWVSVLVNQSKLLEVGGWVGLRRWPVPSGPRPGLAGSHTL